MRLVIKIVFVLAFLMLNACLIMPMVSRGMSWSEAALGIVPGALVAFICFSINHWTNGIETSGARVSNPPTRATMQSV
jgi:uncharacterized membrane protein